MHKPDGNNNFICTFTFMSNSHFYHPTPLFHVICLKLYLPVSNYYSQDYFKTTAVRYLIQRSKCCFYDYANVRLTWWSRWNPEYQRKHPIPSAVNSLRFFHQTCLHLSIHNMDITFHVVYFSCWSIWIKIKFPSW